MRPIRSLLTYAYHCAHGSCGSWQPQQQQQELLGAHAGRRGMLAMLTEAQDEDVMFTLYLCIIVALVLMAGLMSGLTLGLMSLDMVDLEVLKRSGTPEERRHAAKIVPVVKNQHFLLVTLLLCNAAATEALPIFIDRLADPITAVVLSVTVVLFFGEIIPQSICTRYGLKVGAYSAGFVRVLMVLCSPIAWPIGKLLDWVLGPDHSALFRRAQLKALVDLHSSTAGFGGNLSEDEIHVIRGALDLTSKTALKSMTPLEKTFTLSTEDMLDERTLQAVLMSGHSRIPIYQGSNRKNIIGLVLVKELVLINPADSVPVSALKLRELPRRPASTPMYEMLKLFETGRCHMAVLTQSPTADVHSGNKVAGIVSGGRGPKRSTTRRRSPFEPMSGHGDDELLPGELEPVGIITIEDVIEELLQEEIIDETDQFVDNLQNTRVNAAMVTGSLPKRVRHVLNAGLFTPRVGRLGAAQRPSGSGASAQQRWLTGGEEASPILGSSPEASSHHPVITSPPRLSQGGAADDIGGQAVSLEMGIAAGTVGGYGAAQGFYYGAVDAAAEAAADSATQEQRHQQPADAAGGRGGKGRKGLLGKAVSFSGGQRHAGDDGNEEASAPLLGGGLQFDPSDQADGGDGDAPAPAPPATLPRRHRHT